MLLVALIFFALFMKGGKNDKRPLSDSARAWIEENVSREGYHPDWPILFVEHRYAEHLAAGMQADGLVLA